MCRETRADRLPHDEQYCIRLHKHVGDDNPETAAESQMITVYLIGRSNVKKREMSLTRFQADVMMSFVRMSLIGNSHKVTLASQVVHQELVGLAVAIAATHKHDPRQSRSGPCRQH